MTIRWDDAKENQKRVTEALGEYSKTAVEHWLSPRNFKALELADGHARMTGPCGDTMEMFIRVKGGEIVEASFVTDGCLGSIVSGSMSVELATGKSIAEVRFVAQDDILDALDGLPQDSEHCALLAANTLRTAVDDYVNEVGETWKQAYDTWFKE